MLVVSHERRSEFFPCSLHQCPSLCAIITETCIIKGPCTNRSMRKRAGFFSPPLPFTRTRKQGEQSRTKTGGPVLLRKALQSPLIGSLLAAFAARMKQKTNISPSPPLRRPIMASTALCSSVPPIKPRMSSARSNGRHYLWASF